VVGLRWLSGPIDVELHSSPEERISSLQRVHLWLCDLDAYRAGPEEIAFLSKIEIERALRLKSAAGRSRLISRSAFVRRVLGNIVGCNPRLIELEKGTCGKPSLSPFEGAPDIRFSPSHSDAILGLAVTSGVDLGLDIEVVNLQAKSNFRSPLHFYYAWTRKEATGKMLGTGIIPVGASRREKGEGVSLHSFLETFRGKELVGCLALEEPRGRIRKSLPLAARRTDSTSVSIFGTAPGGETNRPARVPPQASSP
jgi:hypothetical protein